MLIFYCSGIMDSNPMTPQSEGGGEPIIQHPSMDHIRTMKTRIGVESSEDADCRNALYYLERLQKLQEQAGHDPSYHLLDGKQQQSSPDNVINDENLNRTSMLDDRPEEVSDFPCRIN